MKRYFRRPSTKRLLVALFTSFLVITLLFSRRYNVSPKWDLFKFKTVNLTVTEDFGLNCDYKNYHILASSGRQDDPCLIELVRNEFMVPPSTLPYNPNNSIGSEGNPDIPGNREKLRILKKYLIDKAPRGYRGFFVDCGANDGEFISSTLKLEQDFGWSGLLVEADPETYTQLRSKNRKAWSINAGACTTPYAQKIILFTRPTVAGLVSPVEWRGRGVNSPTSVQCFPLYTMLAAINVTTVDYLSLDVEGLELAVLQTIPFERIKFKVIIVEYKHIPGGHEALEKFLKTKDYVYVKEIRDQDDWTMDSVFIHKSLNHTFRSEFMKVSEHSEVNLN